MQRPDPAKLTATIDMALARLRGYVPPGSWQSYGFALLCALGAGLFELWLKWLDPHASPLIAYYPVGGLRRGVRKRTADRLIGLCESDGHEHPLKEPVKT